MKSIPFGILILTIAYSRCALANDVNYSDIAKAAAAAAVKRQHNNTDPFEVNPTLLLAEYFSLTRIRTNAPVRRMLIRDSRIGGIAYHWQKNKLFWTDLGTGRINERKLHLMPLKYDRELFVEQSPAVWRPVALAVDYVADHLYVLDGRGKKVYVFDMDGKKNSTILENYLKNPTDIALDPREGYMFIADGTKIIRANMDGTNATAIVGHFKYKIRSVTIDVDSKRIYWSDKRYHRIKSANYDGSEFLVVLKNDRSNKFQLLGPINLAFLDGELFFYDDIFRRIASVEVDHKSRRGLVNTYRDIYDGVSVKAMRMIHPSLQKSIADHPCASDNGGCDNLCLPEPQKNGQLSHTCV